MDSQKPYPYIIPPAEGSIEQAELLAMSAEPEPKYSPASEMDADQWDSDFRFISELEKRSMSTWSEEEIRRYSDLTKQADDYARGQVADFCREATKAASRAGNGNIAKAFERIAAQVGGA